MPPAILRSHWHEMTGGTMQQRRFIDSFTEETTLPRQRPPLCEVAQRARLRLKRELAAARTAPMKRFSHERTVVDRSLAFGYREAQSLAVTQLAYATHNLQTTLEPAPSSDGLPTPVRPLDWISRARQVARDVSHVTSRGLRRAARALRRATASLGRILAAVD